VYGSSIYGNADSVASVYDGLINGTADSMKLVDSFFRFRVKIDSVVLV